MATIYIENKPYQVNDGQNLLRACLSLGLNVPYFCWHPAMGSVGACRQCAVKMFRDENDSRGRLTMACMTQVSDGMRISIEDPEAQKFRATVVETLMANHPHDCPVCCEGGECHLQDMTVMSGHVYRIFRFKKKTYSNQNLGPFVDHEMNRCIACYRCVRFYRDYADGKDLNVYGVHNHVYFGRQTDGKLESEFSGNLVEICPTGVFTDKMMKKQHARKWDLQTAPSVCVHCSVGCNTFADERYGRVRRIHSRYNSEVNRYFLCDRGRYGFTFVNSKQRIRKTLMRNQTDGKTPSSNASSEPVAKEQALHHVVDLIKSSNSTVGIGSPRASLESNFALRSLVGPDNFILGMSEIELRLANTIIGIIKNGSAPAASLNDIEHSDAVFVLGEDVTNVAPQMALSLRQAARRKPINEACNLGIPDWNDGAIRTVTQDARGSFYIATPYPTRLDEIATKALQIAPDDLARLGFAVAHVIDSSSPEVKDLPEGLLNLAHEIAGQLMKAENPLVISGTGCRNATLLHAAANIAWALRKTGRKAKIAFTLPECNSLGLAMMGGQPLEHAFQAAEQGKIDSVIVMEDNLYRHADVAKVDAFLKQTKHLIAIDYVANDLTAKAEVMLPGGTFAESDGTLVNYEGRAQRFYQVFIPGDDIQESWRWLRDIMILTKRYAGASEWHNLDDITLAMAKDLPAFALVPEIAPPAAFRIEGMKIARQSHRASGRTSMLADRSVHEPKPPEDIDSALSFSMEGAQGIPPAPLVPRFWAPGWNSVQAVTRFQEEINGPLRGGDPGKRLIVFSNEQCPYFDDVPKAFEAKQGEWVMLPVYHIFGSEELSLRTPEIAELAPKPYIVIGPVDAKRLGVSEGEMVSIQVENASHRVPAQIVFGIPEGIAGLPDGLSQLRSVVLPRRGNITKDA